MTAHKSFRDYINLIESAQQLVTEGLSEARNSLFAFVKQQFPTWPDYVLKDFLYQQAKGIRNQAELNDFLKRNKQDFGNCKWTLTKLPITFDIFTTKTQRMLASREGGSSNPFQVPRDAERHAQQSQMIQQKGVSAEPIIVAKLSNGYDLIEGWHRTIQHLKAFPQGYTGPAWVCTGATYKSESVEQGVAEARGLAPTKPYDDLMANMGFFMSLNTVKIQQDAIDSNAQQELANMQQQFRKPILNGMSFFDVTRDMKISKNPKVAPILLKYVYDMLGYIEPRIKKYIKPEQQGKYLDRLNQIKNDYRGAVAQVS